MDLSFLRPLFDAEGPWASVYMATDRAAEDGAAQVELRWRHVRDALAGQGADQATIDAVERAVTDPETPAPGRAVFASQGRVALTEALPEPPAEDLVRWERLPDPLPLLFGREEGMAYVSVLVDRVGADIVAVGAGRAHQAYQTDVKGRDWPVRKVRQGGWSEARYQRSAEETWRENAVRVANEVRAEADGVGAELLVVGGDERARGLLLAELPEGLRKVAVVAGHGSRSDDGAWEREVRALVEERLTVTGSALVEELRERIAKGEGVTGLEGTVAALREGAVETLLLAGEPKGELWLGGGLVGGSEREMRELGVTGPVACRAGSVLVCAAVGTDASLLTVDHAELPLSDDVGAVLRFVR
jgi:hypothetical protein